MYPLGKYANYSASNLNFNLYKGGKQSRTKKRKMRGRGFSIFRTEPPAIKKIANQCETSCMPEAEKFCKTSCRSAAISTIESKNTGMSKQFIETIEARLKTLEQENIKLREENTKYKLREEILAESRRH
jgi:hypothetical protein